MKIDMVELYEELQNKEIEFDENRKKFNLLLKARGINRMCSDKIDSYFDAKIFYTTYEDVFHTNEYGYYDTQEEPSFNEYKKDLIEKHGVSDEEATIIVSRHFAYDECGYMDTVRVEDEMELQKTKINFYTARRELLRKPTSVVNNASKKLIKVLSEVENKTSNN